MKNRTTKPTGAAAPILTLVTLLALALSAGAARAAEPAEGSVSPTAPSTGWQGQPATTSNPTTIVDSSLGCRAPTRSLDPACDIYHLTLEAPATGLYNVEITTTTSAGNDYDLYVFDGGGALIGHQATGSGNEKVVLSQLPSGAYEVVVEAWLVLPATSYQGAATLDTSVTEDETARTYHGTRVGPGFEGTPANVPAAKKGQPLKVRATYVGREAAEPTVGVARNGTAFYAAATFDSAVGTARTEILRSRDGGLTWQSVQPRLPAPLESEPPTTLDPYVYVEEDSGRVFSIDLYVGCSYLLYSDDEGETWTRNPLACGDFVNDHQTIFAGPPPANLETQGFPEVLYYCFNRVADSSCGRSVDGGDTFLPTRDPAYIGVNDEGAFCGGLHAHLSTDGEGRVFLPKGHCDDASVSISEDGGDSWQVVKINDFIEVADHEVNLAVDAANNLYALWWDAADRLPYLATSTDHGQTWSTPLMIAPPGVHEVNFPTLAAGDPGRIALTFPGTTSQAQGDLRRPWNSYVVVSTDALAENPLFTWTTANDLADPIHRGNCGPGRCGGMFDFLDMVVSPHDGSAWATAVDTCTGGCVNGTAPAAAMDGVVVRQVRGPSLWASGHKK
jgi:hypothetical protein